MSTQRPDDPSNGESYYELMWPGDRSAGIAYAPSSFGLLFLHPNEELLTDWDVPTFHLKEGPFVDYQPSNAVTHLCSQKMRDIIEAHRYVKDAVEWLPVEIVDAPLLTQPELSTPLTTPLQLEFPELAVPELDESQRVRKTDSNKEKERSNGQGQTQGQRHWELRPYYILHLLEELDVVDTSLSIMAEHEPPFVVKPHLILAKIGEHQIFRYKYGGDSLCVSNKIRQALLESNCTGCHLWMIPAS